MSMTQTYETIDEFTVEKREYDFTNGPSYFVRLTGTDDCITSKYCKTQKAVGKLVEKARAIVARKAAKKAAAKERHAAKDAAKGVVREECQICEGGWVITDGITSLHGYTRPGHGWLVGECMGAKQLPFSKSCALLASYRRQVVNYKSSVTMQIADLKADKVNAITRSERRYVTISFGYGKYVNVDVVYERDMASPDGANHKSFDEVVKIEIAKLEGELKHVAAEIKRVDARIALWGEKYGN